MCVPVWCMPAGAARGVLCRGHTRVAAAPVFHLRQACIWCVAAADVLLCCRTLLFKQHQPNLVLSLAGSHAMRVSAAYSRAAYASIVTWRGKHCMHAVCLKATALHMICTLCKVCIAYLGQGPTCTQSPRHHPCGSSACSHVVDKVLRSFVSLPLRHDC